MKAMRMRKAPFFSLRLLAFTELYKTGHGTLFSLSKFFCQF